MSRTQALALLAVVAGCAGTRATFEGDVCGKQVAFSVQDIKDRETFSAGVDVTAPDGTTCSAHIDTTASVVSTVIDSYSALAEKFATAFAAGTLP